MTHTCKFAWRPAVSLDFPVRAGFLVLAACVGGTAPDNDYGAHLVSAHSLIISPVAVNARINQADKSRVTNRNTCSDTTATYLMGASPGGLMSADETSCSPTSEAFKVVGCLRNRHQANSFILVTVPRQPTLVSVAASHNSASVLTGVKTFTATGHLARGTTVPVGMTRPGSPIDRGGAYSVGPTAGSLPTSRALISGGANHFAVRDLDSAGDSRPLSVTWTATGGWVSRTGMYTAGQAAGSYRVVATSSGLADTAAVTLTAPAGGDGIPFGPFHLPNDQYGVRTWYNGTLRVLSTSSVSTDLAAAKARGMRVVVSLSGSRPRFTNPGGTFSLPLWKQRMDLWRPYASLLEAYYADGTIIGNYVVDEPDCIQCWGGQRISYSDVEEMGRYAKEILPSLPTIVRVVPAWFLGAGLAWHNIDVAWAQYGGPLHAPSAKMTPEQFRDKNVADAKSAGLGLIIGMNTLDGGDGSSGLPGTYNLATVKNRWQMSAAEVERAGTAFASEPYACAVLDWRYSVGFSVSSWTSAQAAAIQAFDDRSDVKAALAKIHLIAMNRSAKRC